MKKKKKVQQSPKTENIVPPKEVDVAPEGKGGTAHRHLQQLIKKLGQQRGFHSVVEASVFDGIGSVDVSLEGFERKIAVEVSVTTQGKWESSNIVKCLSAGFDTVVVTAAESKHLNKIKSDIEEEFAQHIKQEQLLFLLPKQLEYFLDTIKASSASTKERVLGYKVETNFVASDNAHEDKLRTEAIAKLMMEKQLKKD